MITIRLKGGMGNQMFQYAFGLAIAHKINAPLQLDLTALLDRSRGDFVYRNYDLTIFNLSVPFAFSPKIIRQLSKLKSSGITRLIRQRVDKYQRFIKEDGFAFQTQLLETALDHTVYEGWFQSHHYFAEIADLVRERFTFKLPIIPFSESLLQQIQSVNSVCLNVRRTDFLKVDTLNATDQTYFLSAANRMAEQVNNPVFFIFSDDVDWCQENIKLDYPICVVGHEHKGEKFGNYLQLMQACRHFIIPNSSFAWWAAWLSQSPDKQVIAPKNWFTDPGIDTTDLVPPEWTRI